MENLMTEITEPTVRGLSARDYKAVWDAAAADDEAAVKTVVGWMQNAQHPREINEVGLYWLRQGELGEAEAAFREAIAADPTCTAAHEALVYMLTSSARHEDALGAARYAAEHASDIPKRGMVRRCLLAASPQPFAGFDEWEDYRREKWPQAFERVPAPEWQGEPLESKRLFVVDEELGAGGTVFYLRWLSLLTQLGADVVVECSAGSHALIEAMPAVGRVIEHGAERPPFDYAVALGSLPYRFAELGGPLQPFPDGYLLADPWRRARMRELLPAGFKVGVAWKAGQPKKSAALEALAPVLAVPGIVVVNLQAGADGDALQGPNVVDVRGAIRDLADLASCVAELDAVIGPDHPAIHLAGALGVRGWVLSPFLGLDWRWWPGLSRSLYYGALKVAHQARPGSWDADRGRAGGDGAAAPSGR
jgi:tetratricopeptide (TPR) repeat protein